MNYYNCYINKLKLKCFTIIYDLNYFSDILRANFVLFNCI